MKLASALPKGDKNGLALVNPLFVERPESTVLVVAVLSCKTITEDIDSGDSIATARISRIEMVDREDTDQAERLLRRALERRLGKTVLPIDLEDEIGSLLKNLANRAGEVLDTDTGELTDQEQDEP